MRRKERSAPALLFLLIGACFLVGSSETVGRHIDPDCIASIGSLIENMEDTDAMLDCIRSRRQEMGDLVDARGDYGQADMIVALDSVLDLRQLAREERCDDDVGNLLRAFREATSASCTSQTSRTGIEHIDLLVFKLTGEIVRNCLKNILERLQRARSRLHPATVHGIEGFLNDHFLDQIEASPVGDLENINWNQILDRLADREQSLLTLGPICDDYLRGMRNQGALARAVLVRQFHVIDQLLYVKKTLMRISFCELLAQPIRSTGLYEAMNNRAG